MCDYRTNQTTIERLGLIFCLVLFDRILYTRNTFLTTKANKLKLDLHTIEELNCIKYLGIYTEFNT